MGRLSRRYILQKCNEKERAKDYQEDRISGLPDDVIVEILSLLTFKEAITTSILSRKWRYLWTFISTSLSFDTGKPLRDRAFDKDEFLRDICNYKAKFIAWMNHVLKVHRGTVVDQFRVCFSLDASYSSVLDSWVKSAIEKRVQKLELNLSNFNGFRQSYPYTFPNLEKLKLPLDYSRITSLRLMSVNVSAEVVQHFLEKCPFLEQLCIVNSTATSNLKIAGGESLKLKYLDLYRCQPLENLEISAPNLVSFSYTGPKKEVPFKNVPLLSELCIGDEYCDSFLLEAPKHLSYLFQLEKLTLVLSPTVTEALDFPRNLPKFYNLKQLELRVGITCGFRLSWFTSLIKAAPILSKFMLKLAFISELLSLGEKAFRCEEYMGRRKKGSHECLKVIEFVGFVGHQTDFELALSLLEISVALEKVTIDTRHPGFMWGPDLLCDAFADREAQDGEGAKGRAQKLRSHVPAGAYLVIV